MDRPESSPPTRREHCNHKNYCEHTSGIIIIGCQFLHLVGFLISPMDVISTESLHVCGTSGTSYIQFLSQMWEASIHIVYVRDFLHSVSQSDVGGLYSYCICQGLLTFSFSVRCGRPLFILYPAYCLIVSRGNRWNQVYLWIN